MSQHNKKNTNQDPFYVIHGYRFLSNTEKTDKKRKKILDAPVFKPPFILTRKMAAEI